MNRMSDAIWCCLHHPKARLEKAVTPDYRLKDLRDVIKNWSSFQEKGMFSKRKIL